MVGRTCFDTRSWPACKLRMGRSEGWLMEEHATLFLPATRPPKMWRYVGTSLAFTAGGVWQIREGDAAGWLVLVLLGLWSLVALLQLLANVNHLRLGPDGFTVVILFATSSYRVGSWWAWSGLDAVVGVPVGAVPGRRRSSSSTTGSVDARHQRPSRRDPVLGLGAWDRRRQTAWQSRDADRAP